MLTENVVSEDKPDRSVTLATIRCSPGDNVLLINSPEPNCPSFGDVHTISSEISPSCLSMAFAWKRTFSSCCQLAFDGSGLVTITLGRPSSTRNEKLLLTLLPALFV